MTNRFRRWYDRWRVEMYPRVAPILVVFTLAVASFASVGVLWLTKVQGDEQDRRAVAITGLQDCFDTYAMRSSATSKAVRDASVELSDATTNRDVALNDLFKYIATDPPAQSPEAVRLFQVLLSTNAALVAAQAHLATVRADNPVPDPPSTFCDVKP